MAKKNVTYVAQEKFLQIAQEKGATCTEQAGFVRVEFGLGHRLYVARTKNVGRVDVSAFTTSLPGVRTLPEGERFGNVSQQLDMARDEAAILATFASLLDEMRGLPKLEKAPRKSPAKKAPEAPAEPAAPADPKHARRKAISDRAQVLMATKHLPLQEAISEAQAEMSEEAK